MNCDFSLHVLVIVGRIKQKRGYKDQWPWNIKIYRDEAGNSKGDAVLSYEDPSAAHSAGGFYNGILLDGVFCMNFSYDYDMRGHRISVTMAEKSAPRAPSTFGGHGYVSILFKIVSSVESNWIY
eukprot:Gb_25471 [translate_table: standard]